MNEKKNLSKLNWPEDLKSKRIKSVGCCWLLAQVPIEWSSDGELVEIFVCRNVHEFCAQIHHPKPPEPLHSSLATRRWQYMAIGAINGTICTNPIDLIYQKTFVVSIVFNWIVSIFESSEPAAHVHASNGQIFFDLPRCAFNPDKSGEGNDGVRWKPLAGSRRTRAHPMAIWWLLISLYGNEIKSFLYPFVSAPCAANMKHPHYIFLSSARP